MAVILIKGLFLGPLLPTHLHFLPASASTDPLLEVVVKFVQVDFGRSVGMGAEVASRGVDGRGRTIGGDGSIVSVFWYCFVHA